MRLIDADATIECLRESICKECDRRKGVKNGKIRFCYEIGDAPCRACDIEDTIDFIIDEAISPTVDAVPVVRCKDCAYAFFKEGMQDGCIVCTKPFTEQWQVIKLNEWYCADGVRKEGRQAG